MSFNDAEADAPLGETALTYASFDGEEGVQYDEEDETVTLATAVDETVDGEKETTVQTETMQLDQWFDRTAPRVAVEEVEELLGERLSELSNVSVSYRPRGVLVEFDVPPESTDSELPDPLTEYEDVRRATPRTVRVTLELNGREETREVDVSVRRVESDPYEPGRGF